MAKRQYIDYKKAQSELFKRTEGYAANVGAAYRSALTQIINLVKGTELEAGKPFSFSEYGYSDEVTPILRSMYSRVYQIIRAGVEKEWLTANEHNDGLVKAIFGEHSIEDNHFAKFFQRNMEAMNAFFSRKTGEGGLNLSQKVWKYTGIYKDELEDALDLAIGEGTPANRLATQIQKYLNDPDRFYRRFRVKIGENEDGTPKYGRIWKRRVFDAETNSYKWVDDDPRKYHPGRGVYRSSYRNAQRLARTETNIAYRTADYERWQQMDFVIGIEIKLSNNHPCVDICDDLKGIYPKNFKWTGWHPNCRCYQEPVLASPAELDKMLDNILDGKAPSSGVDCKDEVKELPEHYNQWKEQNKDRIERAEQNKTLPYFLRDNKGKVYGIDKETKTDYINESIRIYNGYDTKLWSREYFDISTGGFNVLHQLHQFSKTKSKGALLSGGEAELAVGKILAKQGKRVEYLPESGVNGKSGDMAFDGEVWDVKYIPAANVNTIRKYIVNGKKADNVIFCWDDIDKLPDLRNAIASEVGNYRKKGRESELPNIYWIDKTGNLKVLRKKIKGC